MIEYTEHEYKMLNFDDFEDTEENGYSAAKAQFRPSGLHHGDAFGAWALELLIDNVDRLNFTKCWVRYAQECNESGITYTTDEIYEEFPHLRGRI